MASEGKVPVMECARAGYVFLRENFVRLMPTGIAAALFAAIAGAFMPLLPGGAPPSPLIAPSAPLYLFFAPVIGAAAQAQGLPSAGGTVGLLALVLALAAAFTHLAAAYRLAGPQPPAEPIVQAAIRLGAAFTGIAFVFAIFWAMVMVVLMMLFAAAVQALGLSPQALEAMSANMPKMMEVAEQALATGPGGLVLWALAAAILAVAWILIRLCLFTPATVLEGRVLTFRTWGWTAGQTLRIAGAGAIVFVPLAAGSLAAATLLATIAAIAQGAGGVTPATLFAFNFALALPLTLVVTPAMAGLAAYLYRGLKPA